MGRIPDFFVVGAAKSGTTALWNYFQQHPDIYVTTSIAAKELGYFSNQYGVNDKRHYSSFFKNAKPHQLIGEVCHVYSTSSESAEWIKGDVPEAKIIMILRNPIDRAYSLYNWMTMHGYENIASFEKALRVELNRYKNKEKLLHTFYQNYQYFSSGLYFKQVQRYFDVFGNDRVLVLAYENFNQDQLENLNRVYDFLGVRRVENLSKEKINKSNRVISIKLQYILRRLFIRNKHYAFLNKLLTGLLKLNEIKRTPKSLNESLRLDLQNKYKNDVLLLSQLCDYDFLYLWFNENK